jgi:hypothetical protein
MLGGRFGDTHHPDRIDTIIGVFSHGGGPIDYVLYCFVAVVAVLGIIFGLITIFSGKKIGKILCILYIITLPILYILLVVVSTRLY